MAVSAKGFGSLLNMLEDGDTFTMAFEDGIKSANQDMTKQTIQSSSTFMIGTITYNFNEKDDIFRISCAKEPSPSA